MDRLIRAVDPLASMRIHPHDHRVSEVIGVNIDGQRLERHVAGRIVRRIAAVPDSPTGLVRTPVRHAFITLASTPAYRSVTSKEPPVTPIRAPPCATTVAISPAIATYRRHLRRRRRRCGPIRAHHHRRSGALAEIAALGR